MPTIRGKGSRYPRARRTTFPRDGSTACSSSIIQRPIGVNARQARSAKCTPPSPTTHRSTVWKVARSRTSTMDIWRVWETVPLKKEASPQAIP